ncbi:hypothetical protein HZH68_004248 [Vespula germanica]|uniref:Uncharacterized protein n=1 Tax=Vespula germanica TaxID=30212 RepID=A0A834KNK4_VESGE|nr:hypothetical protein HZH68_004248 [Vespula germanica]
MLSTRVPLNVSKVPVTAPREVTFMFAKGFLRHTMNKAALKYLQKYNTISVYLVVFKESLTQNLSVFKRSQGRNIGMLFSCSLRTVREVLVGRECALDVEASEAGMSGGGVVGGSSSSSGGTGGAGSVP